MTLAAQTDRQPPDSSSTRRRGVRRPGSSPRAQDETPRRPSARPGSRSGQSENSTSDRSNFSGLERIGVKALSKLGLRFLGPVGAYLTAREGIPIVASAAAHFLLNHPDGGRFPLPGTPQRRESQIAPIARAEEIISIRQDPNTGNRIFQSGDGTTVELETDHRTTILRADFPGSGEKFVATIPWVSDDLENLLSVSEIKQIHSGLLSRGQEEALDGLGESIRGGTLLSCDQAGNCRGFLNGKHVQGRLDDLIAANTNASDMDDLKIPVTSKGDPAHQVIVAADPAGANSAGSSAGNGSSPDEEDETARARRLGLRNDALPPFDAAMRNILPQLARREIELAPDQYRALEKKVAESIKKITYGNSLDPSTVADAIRQFPEALLDPNVSLAEMVQRHNETPRQRADGAKRTDASIVGTRNVALVRDGSYSLVELLTPPALKDESELMLHCVGDEDQHYARAVAEGRTRIYSLRSEDGKPLITIEYTPETGAIEQIKGEHNQMLTGKEQHYGAVVEALVQIHRENSSGQGVKTIADLNHTDILMVDNQGHMQSVGEGSALVDFIRSNADDQGSVMLVAGSYVNVTPNLSIGILSGLAKSDRITLNMTHADQEQRSSLTVVEGNLLDYHGRPSPTFAIQLEKRMISKKIER